MRKSVATNNVKIPYDDYTIHSYHCHPNRPCSCIQNAVSYGFKLLYIMSKAGVKELSVDQTKIFKKRFQQIIHNIAKCGEPADGEHLRFFLEFADQMKCREVLYQAITTLMQSKKP